MHASSHLLLFLQRLAGGRRAAGAVLVSGVVAGCTLITDVNREDIPDPPRPTFPEVDAGPLPPEPTEDASAPDAPGDAGADASGADGGGAEDAG